MTNPNDPAFIKKMKFGPPPDDIGCDGLTKREYFAALAMQGFCANSELLQESLKVAEWAVEQADALIAELNKNEKA